MTKQIPQDVLKVLSQCITSRDCLHLPDVQLDRKLYVAVDKVLKTCGGKWARNKKAHVFEGKSAAEILDGLMLTGTYTDKKQDFGQFDTPPKLAQAVVLQADIQSGDVVLEPSAGVGRLVAAAVDAGANVYAVEVDPDRAASLHTQRAYQVDVADFLNWEPRPEFEGFDKVVMNPPFARGADVAHVRKAFTRLKPGGRLVAIMSASVTFREDKRFKEFRAFMADHGAIVEHLGSGSFKESGTMVNTVMVSMKK